MMVLKVAEVGVVRIYTYSVASTDFCVYVCEKFIPLFQSCTLGNYPYYCSNHNMEYLVMILNSM